MRLFVIIFATSGLFACSDSATEASPSSTQTKDSKTVSSGNQDASIQNRTAHIPEEELQVRRQQVIDQVNKLRDRELNSPPMLGFVAIPNPVPAILPGTKPHEWSQDDQTAEGIGMLEFSPGEKGGGSTYAQFQVDISEDGSDFKITAKTDLDGDGNIGVIEATKDQTAHVVDSQTW